MLRRYLFRSRALGSRVSRSTQVAFRRIGKMYTKRRSESTPPIFLEVETGAPAGIRPKACDFVARIGSGPRRYGISETEIRKTGPANAMQAMAATAAREIGSGLRFNFEAPMMLAASTKGTMPEVYGQ